jgi:hypothetical protein
MVAIRRAKGVELRKPNKYTVRIVIIATLDERIPLILSRLAGVEIQRAIQKQLVAVHHELLKAQLLGRAKLDLPDLSPGKGYLPVLRSAQEIVQISRYGHGDLTL